MSTLAINYFPVEITPSTLTLPLLEYGSWEESSIRKEQEYSAYSTWRYQPDRTKNLVRLVFLSGPQTPSAASEGVFDLGEYWRIGQLSIEDSVASSFAANDMAVERAHFDRLALRRIPDTVSDVIDLFVGVSFRAKRPFREERYSFVLVLTWEVRALFRDTLENETLRKISPGMSVIYKPEDGKSTEHLAQFQNRFLGHLHSLEKDGYASVLCKDNEIRRIPVSHLRLEASPSTVKKYEQFSRGTFGPSQFFRRVQQLNMTLTNENRRNVSVLRDRLHAIRTLLQQLAGASRDQLVIPLTSYQQGTVTIGLSPIKTEFGAIW
jgi:hypothetical protein